MSTIRLKQREWSVLIPRIIGPADRICTRVYLSIL